MGEEGEVQADADPVFPQLSRVGAPKQGAHGCNSLGVRVTLQRSIWTTCIAVDTLRRAAGSGRTSSGVALSSWNSSLVPSGSV